MLRFPWKPINYIIAFFVKQLIPFILTAQPAHVETGVCPLISSVSKRRLFRLDSVDLLFLPLRPVILTPVHNMVSSQNQARCGRPQEREPHSCRRNPVIVDSACGVSLPQNSLLTMATCNATCELYILK